MRLVELSTYAWSSDGGGSSTVMGGVFTSVSKTSAKRLAVFQGV